MSPGGQTQRGLPDGTGRAPGEQEKSAPSLGDRPRGGWRTDLDKQRRFVNVNTAGRNTSDTLLKVLPSKFCSDTDDVIKNVPEHPASPLTLASCCSFAQHQQWWAGLKLVNGGGRGGRSPPQVFIRHHLRWHAVWIFASFIYAH